MEHALDLFSFDFLLIKYYMTFKPLGSSIFGPNDWRNAELETLAIDNT